MDRLAAVTIGQFFNSRIGNDKLPNPVTLGQVISNSLTAALVIGGLCLLFFIIFGGLSMISGAGNNNPQDAAKGKQAATYAVLGFAIVFIAYWVIQLIELITGQSFVTAPRF